MIQAGAVAPDFTLPSDDAGDVTLSALRGRPVVLYFYPQDNTPTCTDEACAFRDGLSGLGSAVVLGVSPDSVRKHANFRKKHGLTFPLLADEARVVHDLYGVWGEKQMFGRQYMGTLRTTFLIDAEGVVRRVWEGVRVKGHVDEVAAAVAALG
jgi:peroxiredoxin Q/BCP